jgi:hypothetical protein
VEASSFNSLQGNKLKGLFMERQITSPPTVWYCASGAERSGPFTAEQLNSLARTSKLRPDDLVWREGMDKWEVAKSVNGLFAERNDELPSVLSKFIGPRGSLNLRSIALAQKLLIFTIAGYFPVLIFWPLLFIVIPLQLAALTALCVTLKWTVVRTAVVMVTSCIPYVGVIPLLWVNQCGTRVLMKHDIAVGFWGVHWKSIPVTDRFVSSEAPEVAR